MSTYSPKAEDVTHDWYVLDAANKPLGRVATEIARRLQGKHKPTYSKHMDMGDYIVVINAKDVAVTGNKAQDKIYYHHTGFPGGIKSISFEKQIEKKPEKVIELAVKGMLPKGPLGRAMYRKLRVYADDQHNHTAQQPKALEL